MRAENLILFHAQNVEPLPLYSLYFLCPYSVAPHSPSKSKGGVGGGEEERKKNKRKEEKSSKLK